MTSQKEFMIGCLVGGVIGALGTLAVPKKYVDNLMSFNSTKKNISLIRAQHLSEDEQKQKV